MSEAQIKCPYCDNEDRAEFEFGYLRANGREVKCRVCEYEFQVDGEES